MFKKLLCVLISAIISDYYVKEILIAVLNCYHLDEAKESRWMTQRSNMFCGLSYFIQVTTTYKYGTQSMYSGNSYLMSCRTTPVLTQLMMVHKRYFQSPIFLIDCSGIWVMPMMLGGFPLSAHFPTSRFVCFLSFREPLLHSLRRNTADLSKILKSSSRTVAMFAKPFLQHINESRWKQDIIVEWFSRCSRGTFLKRLVTGLPWTKENTFLSCHSWSIFSWKSDRNYVLPRDYLQYLGLSETFIYGRLFQL